MNLEKLRFPIGPQPESHEFTEASIANGVERIRALPSKVRTAISGWSDQQLDTPYRPEGWTVRQLIHHLADSHLNGYLRFKWVLTEEDTTIKPYNQDKWAVLADSQLPVEVSLNIIEGIHARWAYLAASTGFEDFARSFTHPEEGKLQLGSYIGNYAWHGDHHLAHITELAKRENW